MTTTPLIQLNLTMDPSAMPAEDFAAYAAQVVATLTTALARSAVAPAGSPSHIVGVDKQLARLMDANPVFAPRVKKLHEALIALGYVPTLPTSKKGGPLAPFLHYVDPATGVNLGYLNSRTFYVIRAGLRDQLEALPHFEANSRYAYTTLVSDDAVDAVVKVAQDQKVTSA